MLKKLRASLHEFFNPPAAPVTPPPLDTPFNEWKPAQVTAARKLLKEGQPESLASLIESLPPRVYGEDRGYSHSLRRPVVVHYLIEGLDAAQVLQAFSQSTPEKKQQLLDETLAYTVGVQDRYPHSNPARIEALRNAGAVDTPQDPKNPATKPVHIRVQL